MEPREKTRTRLSTERVSGLTHLRLPEALDETLPETLLAGADGQVLLDLGAVRRVTPAGIRRWKELTRTASTQVQGLWVVFAPSVVIDQYNLVDGFAGATRLLSVLAPYRCERCQKERIQVVNASVDASAIGSGRTPVRPCPVCAAPLEFADDPTEFFEFLRNQELGAVDPLVERYLDAVLRPGGATAPIKLVEGELTFIALPGRAQNLNVRRLAAGMEGRVVYDVGALRSMDAELAERLRLVLEKAAASAEILLWRVTPATLDHLEGWPPLPGVGIASAWLPTTCACCGTPGFNRMRVEEVLASGPRSLTSRCRVCGDVAKGRVEERWLTVLRRMAAPLPRPIVEQVSTLEHRAFDQLLHQGLTVPEPLPELAAAPEEGQASLQLIRKIGQGGMAEVFLGRRAGPKGFEKYVVVKRVLPQFASSPVLVDLLFAEARANARLTHPNIVQTFEVGMHEGTAFIAMEFVRGPDVKRLMGELRRAGKLLPLQHALRIVAETAAGLHYAHAYVDPTGTPHPMVHRDVSPHNVLVSLDGAIKLSDFGIAKVQGETPQTTRVGIIKGKVSYVSPEAVRGKPIDARADVFALGVMLYELLTGRVPFRRENDGATLRAILKDKPVAPTLLVPSIPEDVSAIVLATLEKDRDKRTPSAAHLREALEAALARHGLYSTPARIAEWMRGAIGPALAEFDPTLARAQAPSGGDPEHTLFTPIPEGLRVGAEAEERANQAGSGAFEVSEGSIDISPAASLLDVSAGEGFEERPLTLDSNSFELIRASGSQPGLASTPAPTPAAGPALALPPPLEDTPDDATQLVPESALLFEDAQPPPPPPPAPRAVKAAKAPAVEPPAPEMSGPSPPPRPGAAGGLSTRLKIGIVAAGLALGSAGALLLVRAVTDTPATAIQVEGLAEGELLYLDGVRAQSPRSDGRVLTAAVARDGLLVRAGLWGGAEAGVLDTSRLQVPQEREGAATLLVRSDPDGCMVQVGGNVQLAPTPLETSVPAGREVEVRVICAGREPWAGWVLGVPGQRIELSAGAERS